MVGRHWPIIDCRRSACEAAERLAGRDPRVAGAGVGVVERLGEQCLAGLEVVVHERGRDAGVHRDPRDPDAVDPLAGDPADRGGEDPVACLRSRCGAGSRRLVASERGGEVGADPVGEPGHPVLAA